MMCYVYFNTIFKKLLVKKKEIRGPYMPSCFWDGWYLFIEQNVWNLENQFEITSGTEFFENLKQLLDILLGKFASLAMYTVIKDALTSKCWPNFWFLLPALLHDADNLHWAVLKDVFHIWPIPRFNAHYQLLFTDSIYKAKKNLSWLSLRSCISQAGRWQNLDNAAHLSLQRVCF